MARLVKVIQRELKVPTPDPPEPVGTEATAVIQLKPLDAYCGDRNCTECYKPGQVSHLRVGHHKEHVVRITQDEVRYESAKERRIQNGANAVAEYEPALMLLEDGDVIVNFGRRGIHDDPYELIRPNMEPTIPVDISFSIGRTGRFSFYRAGWIWNPSLGSNIFKQKPTVDQSAYGYGWRMPKGGVLDEPERGEPLPGTKQGHIKPDQLVVCGSFEVSNEYQHVFGPIRITL